MHTNVPARFTARFGRVLAALALTLGLGGMAQAATTKLSDLPTYSASNVPANLMLALSVEFPTGTVAAYTDNAYASTGTYLGYFDNSKCYAYSTDAIGAGAQAGYFYPVTCNAGSTWRGNFLNWVSMTALDEFRQSLTGGNRSYDTAGLTLLRRSNLNDSSTIGNFPNKSIATPKGQSEVPFNAANDLVSTQGLSMYFRSYKLNNSFRACLVACDTVGAIYKTYNVQVQVCKNKATAEANCTAYGSNYKPEGLIQSNFERIRVGASAYVYSDGSVRPNGLVRALLRDNGPTTYNGNGARQPNTYTEWSATDGTFSANPAKADSEYSPMTTFTKSGVINYLNQFGDNGYETFDTISELYWATLAYMKQTPLDAAYSSGTVDLDKAFPSFTGKSFGKTGATSNDPIQYSCQANAIVVIGDSHTHCDAVVPTSGTLPAPATQCKATNPLVPATNGGVDAKVYLDKMGGFPLLEAIGGTAASDTLTNYLGGSPSTIYEPNTTNSPTYNIAGLAYYAHTNDIRPDTGAAALTGPQTVDTYVVDVLEPGYYDGSSGHDFYNPTKIKSGGGPNAYWLAAKYGGFADTAGDGRPASQLTWHTNGTTKTATRPDNYFPGNRPDLIQAGLAQIFSHVTSTKSLSASGPSVSSTRVLNNVVANTIPYNSPVSGFPIYASSYVPGAWSGDVTGYVAAAAIGTDVTPVSGGNTWSAQAQLDLLTQTTNSSGTIVGWDTARSVISYNGSNKGIPFRFDELTSDQQKNLTTGLVNYLRGDRSQEGVTYNIRAHVLGDIVDSQPTLVQGALSPQYRDSANPGYAAFVTAQASRTPMVYVGANDGMMHAFSADFSKGDSSNPLGGGGSERFAYVPSFLYAGPSTPSAPYVDGLAALGNLNGVTTGHNYAHHFYVNQTPQAADVDFWLTSNKPGKDGKFTGKKPKPDWHTLLVGGLGKGGKGIYALDVTTPPDAPRIGTVTKDTEKKLAESIVKWEFTDPTMGLTYARPLVVKTRRYGWVVAVTSGYNNSDGVGYLYIISAKDGTLLDTMSTGVGTATTPSGLGRPSGFTQDVSDNTVDQIYAGDLLGNVWRFDVSGTGDDKYPPPVLLATLTDAGGTPQPITTAPRIELSFDSTGQGTRRWVFVGTGKYLDASDLTSTQKQTMYALRDGTALTPSTPAKPLTRSVLKVNDLTTGLILNDSDKGWYYDLTGTAPGTGGAAERIVVDPDAVAGIFSVAWATLIPTADPCSLAGAIYSANFDTGKSTLLDALGNSLPSVPTTTATTSLQLVQLPNGQFVVLYGQTGQVPATSNLVQPGGPPFLRRTNWREILN